ncbi:MAG: DUF2512 family protein [Firmicutes bacterium]|nr:DUF2512 family protein [Bacillota bacterium]
MKNFNGLLAKFILFPLLVFVFIRLMPNMLSFYTPGQVITLSWLVGLALYLIDLTRLSSWGPLSTSLADFLVSAVMVWGFAFIVKVSIYINFWSVLLVALGIAVLEYLIHRFIQSFPVDLPQQKPRP